MSADSIPTQSLSFGQQSKDSINSDSLVDHDCWLRHSNNLINCLNGLEISSSETSIYSNDQAFEIWKDKTISLRQNGRVIYLLGNGASASMASHFSADLAKNAEVHTQVFTDLALITALANDVSYDQVFVEPLRNRLTAGDMVVGISSSGNSPNVVNACRFASEIGADVVTVTAMGSENKMRQIGNLNFWIPAKTYGMAETGHAAILHYWMDSVSIY